MDATGFSEPIYRKPSLTAFPQSERPYPHTLMKKYFLFSIATGFCLLASIPHSDGAAASPPAERYLALATAVAPLQAHVSSSETVMDRVIRMNHLPSTVHPQLTIQKTSTLNASTDGTHLYITSALLNKLTSDDEQAFIISHELSHIVLQHLGKTQTRRVGFSILDTILASHYGEGSIPQIAGQLGLGLVDKRSSRTYEYQADDLGVQLMRQAGYDPHAALQVFAILKAASPNSMPGFLMDHPITDDRIRALVNKYQL